MKQSLHLRVGQYLAMTPALQQAIKLLQLSSLDLQQEIRQAVESNLMLEFEEDDGASPSIDEQAAGEPTEPTINTEDAPRADTAEVAEVAAASEETPVDIEYEENWETGGSRSAQDEEDLYDYRQANLTTGRTLRENLRS